MLRKIADKLINRIEPYLVEEVCLRVAKLCNSKSLKEGICVHSPIIKQSLHSNLYINNNILSVYAKCCGVNKARHFFDEMPEKDVVSWTSIMSAYIRIEQYEEALDFFDLMVRFEQSPNEFTLSSAIRASAAVGDIVKGARLQGYVVKQGFEGNTVLNSNLIELYAKCNSMEEAYKLFEAMQNGDVVSWTTMISSVIDNGKWSRGLQLYTRMTEAGVRPNEFTFAKILAAAGSIDLNYGRMVHAHLTRKGVNLNVVLKTALVSMYIMCRRMEDAVKVSNLTPECDLLLWTTIISGFSQNLSYNEAIAAFHEMESSGVTPNNYTYSSILNACSSMQLLELGKQIHSRVIISGLEDDASVGNALIDVYVKCSDAIHDALSVFRGINLPNVISWTTMISGFAEHGYEQRCFDLFKQMQALGVQPNSFTLSAILGVEKSLKQTMKLHAYVIKTNANHDIVVGNALVDTYAKLGMVDDAWRVVNMMSIRDAITYTSLTSRMNQMGHHDMALDIIARMYNDGVKMDEFSLSGFLCASSCLPSVLTGKQLHSHSIKSGLGTWISVSNGLIGLYGKCGFLGDMFMAFNEITKADVVSWNGLISGLTSNGYISSALSYFDDMRLSEVKPDDVTFSFVISACTHGKLFDMGIEYFNSMKEKHGITPQLHHYVCLVDLLCQAGRLDEAVEVLETMPLKPDMRIYKIILNASKLRKNVHLGEDMARRALELNPLDPAVYILLANLYDACGQSEFGEKTRWMMKERGLSKVSLPGHSWIEIKNKVHVFVGGDRSHPRIDEIDIKLESLIGEFNKQGYTSYQENADSSYHSERLAVAFGLVCTPSKAGIFVVVKKLGICRDCHNFMMVVTKLIDREIIMKVGKHIHTFKKGRCSCMPPLTL
ncbi:hypothetical protein ACFE04_017046 [Oxalis oulophora]